MADLLWISRDGKPISVQAMPNRHLLNALSNLQHQRLTLEEACLDPHARRALLQSTPDWIRPAFTPEELLDRTQSWIRTLTLELTKRQDAERHGQTHL